MTVPLLASIERGLDALAIEDDGGRARLLAEYVALLERWNKTYNLTAVRDPAQMVPVHLLDSLTILPFVSGPVVMDVGTGAGLPGIPLSIFTPDIHWLLVDSNGKKTRFIVQAIAQLGLDNVSVRHARIEDVTDVMPDQIVTRALSSVTDMVRSVRHLMAPHTRLLAMKAVDDEAQLLNDATIGVINSRTLTIPGLPASRCLQELGKISAAGES